MKKEQKLERVKMNLAFEKEFYDFLKEQADQDYMKVATWTKRFLKMSLLDENKKVKTLTSHEQAI